MEHHPETEPGLVSDEHRNLKDMSIQDLVSVLRTAFLTEDYDIVEEVLVKRNKRLQKEILRLQEMVELEKLTTLQAEEDLRNREELCQRGKRAQNNYEKLLKEVKKNTNLGDRRIIGELRKKNNELELEVCELRKLKENWVDDRNALSELRIKVDVLENDNNALRVKNSELEKSMEKNSESLSDDVITDSEDSDEESDGDYEPPSRRRKKTQGASSPGMKNINVVVPPSNVQKIVADVVEALIGAFLSTGGEMTALFTHDKGHVFVSIHLSNEVKNPLCIMDLVLREGLNTSHDISERTCSTLSGFPVGKRWKSWESFKMLNLVEESETIQLLVTVEDTGIGIPLPYILF